MTSPSAPLTLASIFLDLCARFPMETIKVRKGSGGEQPYLKAPAIINRLNQVVGPGNWNVDTVPVDVETGAVKVTLTILGTSMSDYGDPNNVGRTAQAFKEASSDGLKRAARLFGIGLYLWMEPERVLAEYRAWEREQAQRQRQTGQSASGEPPSAAPPSGDRDFRTRVQEPIGTPSPMPPSTNGQSARGRSATAAPAKSDIITIGDIDCTVTQTDKGPLYTTVAECETHPGLHFTARKNSSGQLTPFVHKLGDDWHYMPS